MRPRKKIVLLATSEDRLRIVRFILNIRGSYEIFGVANLRSAKETIEYEWPDILVVEDELEEAARSIRPNYHIPTVVFGKHQSEKPRLCDYTVWEDCGQFSEKLLATVKLAASKKRGPKKIEEKVAVLA